MTQPGLVAEEFPQERRSQRPGLLSALPVDGSVINLATHRRRYPAPPTAGSGSRPDLIAVIDDAGLTGRGGAGFPTGRKLRSVAAGRRRPVVVANGTEGEPSSGKDALLLARNPHLALDGALWAAAAVGADRVVVCIDRTNTAAHTSMGRAITERQRVESSARIVELADTPPRYIAGEESALVHWIGGGPATPTATPPRPYQRGLDGRPTLIQNVETLAHLAQIAVFGAAWFRQVGTSAEPGTALFTVSGAVARPAIVEAPIGTPIGQILAIAGGPTGPLQAVLVGGFFGTWLAGDVALGAPCSRAGLRPFGASPGAGIIVALPDDACGLRETARILAWYSSESAGQCGPCVYGLADLAAGSARLQEPNVDPGLVRRLLDDADQIEGRGGCRHPDGAVRLLRSAIRVFADDIKAHLYDRPCGASSDPPRVAVPASTPGWR